MHIPETQEFNLDRFCEEMSKEVIRQLTDEDRELIGYEQIKKIVEDDIFIHLAQFQSKYEDKHPLDEQLLNTEKITSYILTNPIDSLKSSIIQGILKHLQAIKDTVSKGYDTKMEGFLNYNVAKSTAERQIQTMQSEARETASPLALLYLDLDDFGKINKQLGDLAGDIVLSHSAEVISKNLNKKDLKIRKGGEEIVLVLANVTPKDAGKIAERIRTALEQSPTYMIVIDNQAITIPEARYNVIKNAMLAFKTPESDQKIQPLESNEQVKTIKENLTPERVTVDRFMDQKSKQPALLVRITTTVSIGVATLGYDKKDILQAIATANDNEMMAKQTGKNLVCQDGQQHIPRHSTLPPR